MFDRLGIATFIDFVYASQECQVCKNNSELAQEHDTTPGVDEGCT